MKDLTEQIYDELNAQVVRMLEHSLAQASRIADLERQLASAERRFMMACEDLGAINEKLGLDPDDGGAEPIIAAIEELQAAAPQAADTDKVREAILALRIVPPRHYDNAQISAFCLGAKTMCEEAAKLTASMAAQAPVREVPGWQPIETAPKDGREILVRYPKQGNVKQIGNFNTIHKHWESKGARMWAVEQQCEWHPLPADLPAAPVQQEGDL